MKRILILAAVALALVACQPKGKEAAGPTAPTVQSAQSKAFMEKAGKEAGVTVLPSGLAYKIVRSGPTTGLKPQLSDEVKVHYEGKLEDGTVFDSSYERGQPAAMPLKALVLGWQEALQLMRPGDEWILYVPSNLGYGEDGQGQIPPGSPLIFKIELIDVLAGPGRIQQG
ncbi:MAG: FKBP-type peptidyl-prolyl cis-trans isomerase [Alphaproteobacteria bacterium]|nr:FKBP-type peptidyl-prolyl cis-trans isomerase [Alphaproteobacteria bacterium]MBU1517080.1 FKBP-type peptidyl-prolyl cis-trans isomerase [Alphaproteobacteria bacterium]MBU2093699.1 FKBP-type peptidyl-prolyl cis-trans isomerase [Alphaproteobacteria bacterium]MBU2153979.1 FKBP-type peptidyl-prolyl cis-trans isomerase [Alphaproteobacteria bacterium]MBU2308701.1 FKBP-type peptidyl-prolyl cis-trans isomerase [Alphaproteobacteria bacterium]